MILNSSRLAFVWAFLFTRRVLRYARCGKKVHTDVNVVEFGGDEENRTPDPLLARQVLSQLSYTPIKGCLLVHPFAILR